MKNTTDRSKTLRAFWLYPELATGTGAEAFAMSCPTLNAVNMYERQGMMEYIIRLMILVPVMSLIQNMLSPNVTLVFIIIY
ncbi:hypothetical protein SFC43_24140 [Bacteroides sp. CR5/BHMF/2]|nr:hypothetical protein [Bacteroides sp. CR5/BHMF/2]